MHSIILLHGALGSAEDMEPLAGSLRAKKLSVQSFSFSGHGHTPLHDDFGIDRFEKELAGFILQKKLVKPVVFGYSMGGFVALRLALQQPGLLGGVMTLASKFNWTREAIGSEAAMCELAHLEKRFPAFAESLKSRHAHLPELLKRSKTMIENFSTNKFFTPDALSRMKTPVLLGVGSEDRLVTMDETKEMCAQIPGASLYVLPFTKHPLPTASVELLTGVLQAFLGKIN